MRIGKVFSDSVFITVGNFILQLKGLIFLPIIISAIGLTNYGFYIQLMANIALLTPFCTMALGEGFKRFTSKLADDEIEQMSIDFWSVMAPSILVSLLVAFAFYFNVDALNGLLFDDYSEDFAAASKLTAFMIIERVINEQLNKFLMARKRFKANTIFTLLFKLLPYFGLLTGFLLYERIFEAVLFYLILESVMTLILFGIIHTMIRFRLPSIVRSREFIIFSWPLILSQVESGILSKIDRYFISYFLGATELGIYNILYSVTSMVKQLSIPFARYFASYLPELWDAGSKVRAVKQIQLGIRYYFAICWTIVLFLSICLWPVLIEFVSEAAIYNSHINELVLVLGIGIILEGFGRICQNFFRLSKSSVTILGLQFVAAIVCVALNYLLIEPLGLLGAAIATVAGYAVVVVLSVRLSEFNYVDVFGGGYVKTLLLSVPLFSIPFIVNLQNSVTSLLIASLCCLIMVSLIFLTKFISISMLRSLISK